MNAQTLRSDLARFQTPSISRSVGQAATTAAAYVALVTLMYLCLGRSVWLTFVLAIPAAGMVVRLFIIQHDCGHASYFRSRRANELVGLLCSAATFTPYANWRRQHAAHHAVWNNLDRRDSGADIYSSCLTIREYAALSSGKQLLYRAVRHPLVAQLLLPPVIFLLLYRVPFDTPRGWRKERRSVHLTNAILAVILLTLVLTLGVGPVLLVQLPIMVVASIVGVWLFSVQHRFEDTQWERQPDWTAATASLRGSSYLKLPKLLQWFTGNIGFHHVHHLLPRVPNYRLEACHKLLSASTAKIATLSLGDALQAPSFALWDEDRRRMVRFPRKGPRFSGM